MSAPFDIEAAIAASQVTAATKGKPANYAEIVITDDLFAGDFGDGSERTLTDELRIAKRMGPCRECDRGIRKGDLVRVVKMADSEGFYGGRLCAACCDETYARYAGNTDCGPDEAGAHE